MKHVANQKPITQITNIGGGDSDERKREKRKEKKTFKLTKQKK